MKRLVKVRHRQPVGPAATRVGAVIAAVAITGGGMAACSKDDAKDAMSTASSAASSGASAASSGLSSATSAMSSAATAPELRYDVPGGEVILDGDVAKTFTKAGGEQKVGRLTAKPEQQGTGTVFTFENGNIYSSTEAADVVVTMGCGDSCPYFPGKRYENWELADPAGQSVEAIRPIRDDIEQRVRELLISLGVAGVVEP